MKRQHLVRILVQNHCVLVRHGGNHDLSVNVMTGRRAPVPRHSEIKETLARLIMKQPGIES